jgi:3-isopropylmalate/(R)-2-methylmalate dehydratase small subunit
MSLHCSLELEQIMGSPMANLKIDTVTGKAMPLRGNDIDTDQIMPARFLKWITFQGLEAHLFEDLRLQAKAMGRDYPLDDARFADSRIMLVNENFGCGSSREHAPQAILRFGIKALIGESFGEIFALNCVAVGMPCVVASSETVAVLQSICDEDSSLVMELDLVAQTVNCGGRSFPVEIGAGRRRQFLEGSWHSTLALMSAGEAIDAKMKSLPYARWMPFCPERKRQL